MKCHLNLLLLSVVTSVLILPTAAYPQIEEIVVTAQKRDYGKHIPLLCRKVKKSP